MRHMITGLSIVMTIYVAITMVTTVKNKQTHSRDKNNFKIPYVHLVSFCFNLSWLPPITIKNKNKLSGHDRLVA